MSPLYNALLLALDLALLVWILRRPAWTRVCIGALVHQGAGAALAVVLARYGEIRLFAALGLYAWCLFAHGPLVLALLAVLARRERALARTAAVCAIALACVAAYSFHFEPRRLELTRHVIRTDKVSRPLRILVLADIQTDRVSEYERSALRLALQQKPDLVLLTGDYVHLSYRQDWAERRALECGRMRRLFAEEGLAAPLGAHAVRGNTEAPDWEALFAGLPVRTYGKLTHFEAGELQLTALDLDDSAYLPSPIPRSERFHIVFGHMPDFALHEVDADLLIAGHCHGGQVRIPFFGPPLILSRVPRAWTEGLHEIRPGTWLSVSRGIGMERVGAPPLRFNCRPEIVLIELEPAG
jgi:predicted MPP superfamily phosphohydrolase